MAGGADDRSCESDDNSFWYHDLNESPKSPDDDTDDNATAADIPVQDAAAAVVGHGRECTGCVAGCVAGHAAGRAAAKSISLMLIIIYWLMLFIE